MYISVDSQCADPGPIANGLQNPTQSNYEIGDYISYTCNTGTTMSGYSLVYCIDGSIWNNPVPICTGKWVKLNFHMCMWSQPLKPPGEHAFPLYKLNKNFIISHISA